MKHLHFLLFLCLVFTCCTPIDMSWVEEDIWYEVLPGKEADVDFSMTELFDPVLHQLSPYMIFVDKNLIFRAVAIKYKTVNPFGDEIVASGVVYHPMNRKPRGVFDFMPTAHLEKGGGGSDLLYAIEGVLAFEGYTIIMADLIGSGVSCDEPIPFLMAENTGRVAYDMRRAAAKYLWDKFGYCLPAETIISGYSLGGSAALATQKYYETHHSNAVKIKEVYASSGVYDIPAAFEAFARTKLSKYAAIPNTIYAFNHYYKLNLNYDSIFKGPLRGNEDKWLKGDMSAKQLMRELGDDLSVYMHDDFFKPLDQQNGEFKKLQPYFVENSVSEGWRPKAPIYMTHCYEDTYVPFENAEVTVSKLRKAGANVSFMSYPGTHNTVGYVYFLRQLLHFM